MIGDLPDGWSSGTITDLIAQDGIFSDGDWIESKDQNPAGGVRLIQLADIGDGVFLNRSRRYLTEEKAQQLRCKYLQKGDILIARMPDPLGRACIFLDKPGLAVTAVDVCIVRTGSKSADHKWLMWTINSPVFRQQINALQSGSTRQRISRRNLGTISMPIPPVSEQKRIASVVDLQISRLEAAVAALKRAQANLKRYRASVLKAACEGRLVPQDPNDEPASELLKRILAERRAKWEADQRAKGKDLTKVRYEEPQLPDTSDLPELPYGWRWITLEQVTSASRPICYGILMPKENVTNGVPYVRVKDMKHDRVDMESLHRTTPEIATAYARSTLDEGDLLLAIRGTYGRVAEVPAKLNGGNITQDTARLAVSSVVERAFVALCLRGPVIQRYFRKVARGVAVKGVNIADVRLAALPLSPRAEQSNIVAEVERRLSVVDETEAVVNANLKRAERLRQAILKRAFEGQLVPQDSNDEPASVLLERIRAEREKAPDAKAITGRKPVEQTSFLDLRDYAGEGQ